VQIRALCWNLFHGRDGPPDPALYTLRSKLLRLPERNATHVQVNRDLYDRFAALIAGAEWDIALLQECPPRWADPLAVACQADPHRALTSRNVVPGVQGALHRWNPDLTGSWEGGSNLTLVRELGIAERRELVMRPGRPERRTMAFTRLVGGTCVGNIHASNDAVPLAEEEIRLAADTATDWAGDAALIVGGDFNVRPHSTELYAELEERFDLRAPTAPDAIDHLLVRRLEVDEPPRQWPADRREMPWDGLTLRLSDHAPVEALFGATAASASSAPG
jgi:endonuclease/exonuclease/phosphatase family metal-dependent hydrolase